MTAPDIRLFNTMVHEKVPLRPMIPGKLGIYVCGPTVYSYIHIGNARTFTSFDVIVRYLRHRGFEVRYVRNYTDVDDRIIKAAWVVGSWKDQGAPLLEVRIDGTGSLKGKEGTWWTDGALLRFKGEDVTAELKVSEKGLSLDGRQLEQVGKSVTAAEFADFYVRQFDEDVGLLHLITPDVAPKVSDTIPEIVGIIQKLIDRGVGYVAAGDVYFQVSKYPGYGKLSKKNLDDLQAGARVEPGEQKREPADFALWKAAKPGEPSWDSPWGKGRPGWHIECSAMSSKYLGETFDLHGGGLDLIFPHHENEIAQSEAASGKTLCNCWMHANFLDLEGAKMSKSLGNVVKLHDALKRVDPEALRYFLLSTHYRQQLSFSDKSVADAETRLEYFYETLRKVDERIAGKDFGQGPVHGEPGKILEEFDAQMSDDFNFPGAFGVLSGLFGKLNELLEKPPVKDKALVGRTLLALRGIVRTVSSVLGLFTDEPAKWLLRRRDRQVVAKGIDVAKVDALMAQRDLARKAKDFATADRVRAELKAMGVEIMDTPQGTTWKVIAEHPEGV